mmetsp:Transcript_20325/g.24338  ORF Transcript_20325/g.24338 Transcript_20325/m.24338 type:complete len:218 (+) Transcript_20325:933-1586(+)
MTADLTERPRASTLNMILLLLYKSSVQWDDTLGGDDRKSKSFGEGGDVTESHNAWQTVVALGFNDVVDKSTNATVADDQLCEFWSVLGDLTDAGGSVLAHVGVNVLEAGEDLGEDLCFNNDLSKVDGVLRDLRQSRANLTLQLSILVDDQGSEVCNCSGVDNCLAELWCVLGNIAQCRGANALQRQLRFLNAKHEQCNGTSIHDGACKFAVMSRHIA